MPCDGRYIPKPMHYGNIIGRGDFSKLCTETTKTNKKTAASASKVHLKREVRQKITLWGVERDKTTDVSSRFMPFSHYAGVFDWAAAFGIH
jgi:hypothetical protein